MTGFIHHTIIYFHGKNLPYAVQHDLACSLKAFSTIVEKLQFFPSFKDFNT
jgi:hypothetical protein